MSIRRPAATRIHIARIVISLVAGVACAHSRPGDVAPVPSSSNPPADYPVALLDSGVAGRVVIEAMVGTDGRIVPGSARTVQSDHPLFEESARAALARWRFQPAIRNGEPTTFPVRLPFEFALKVPTPQDCREIILRADSIERAQTGERLGRGFRRSLQPMSAVPPRARPGRPARTVAEFQVRSDSTVAARSLRIVESNLPPDVAADELRDALRLWLFHPAHSRGCLYPATTRFEVTY